MKTSLRIEAIGFLLLLGYLAFIPTGPFPVYITGGLRLDVSFGLLLLVFVVFYFPRIKQYPDVFIASWLFYFLIIFFSTILSENIENSSRNAFVIFGYSLVALLVPLVYANCADALRKWLFIVAILVSIIILYMYLFLGYAQGHRFALGVADVSSTYARLTNVAYVDPNMTAAGLFLALIVYFPNLFDNRKRFIFDLLGSVFVITAGMITLSRSAMLGFFVSVSFSFLMVLIKSLSVNNALVHNRRVIFSLVVFLAIVPFIIYFVNLLFPVILDKLIYRIVHSTSDSARINLLVNAWSVFTTDLKTLVIGSGFMTTNPHNEYMRTLSTMGLLGLLSSICFYLSMFYFTIKALPHNYRILFSAWAIIIFMMVISLFYGYTKLIWVAWMFLLLLYRESRLKLNRPSLRKVTLALQ